MNDTSWAIIAAIIITLIIILIPIFILRARGTKFKFAGAGKRMVIFMIIATVGPISILIILLIVTNNICYTILGLGIFILVLILAVTIPEYRRAGQHRDEATVTNRALKSVDADALGLQKKEYYRVAEFTPDVPRPLFSFMGRYKGHLTYVTFDWETEFLAVPDGLKIEMNHIAKFKARVAVPTPFPTDEGEEESREENVEKIIAFLKYIFDKKIMPRMEEIGAIERLYVNDLSVGIRVVKIEKGNALGILLDTLAEVCKFMESQCELLTNTDITKKNKFELYEEDTELVRFDETRVIKLEIGEKKVRELESWDYSDIISLSLGDAKEERVWSNSLDIIFKDQKHIKIDLWDPVTRMGIRAFIFDKLGLLKNKENLNDRGKEE